MRYLFNMEITPKKKKKEKRKGIAKACDSVLLCVERTPRRTPRVMGSVSRFFLTYVLCLTHLVRCEERRFVRSTINDNDGLTLCCRSISFEDKRKETKQRERESGPRMSLLTEDLWCWQAHDFGTPNIPQKCNRSIVFLAEHRVLEASSLADLT